MASRLLALVELAPGDLPIAVHDGDLVRPLRPVQPHDPCDVGDAHPIPPVRRFDAAGGYCGRSGRGNDDVGDRRRRAAGLAAERRARREGSGHRLPGHQRERDRRCDRATSADPVPRAVRQVEQLVGPGGLVAAGGVDRDAQPRARHGTRARTRGSARGPSSTGRQGAARSTRSRPSWIGWSSVELRSRAGSWPAAGRSARASPGRRVGPPTARPRGRHRPRWSGPRGRRCRCRACVDRLGERRGLEGGLVPGAGGVPVERRGAPSRCRSCSRSRRWRSPTAGSGCDRSRRRWARRRRRAGRRASRRRRRATSAGAARRGRATAARCARRSPTGRPGAAPAPLSKRTRTGGSASNLARAAAADGDASPPVGRQRTAPPKISLREDRARGADERRDARHLVGDVEVEEGVPLREDLRREAVGVEPVVEREARDRRPIEAVEEVGEGRTGLLVLPGRREEHRHVDLAGEPTDVERAGDVVGVVRVVAGPSARRRRSGAAAAGCRRRCSSPSSMSWRTQAVPDGSALASTWSAHDTAKPVLRMPPGRSTPVPVSPYTDSGVMALRLGGLRLGHEQLREARVGEAHHPDPVALHPVLGRDRLDHVVAVEHLQRLEEVVGAAGAAGAAHVHPDDGVPHQPGEQRRRLGGRLAQDRAAAPHSGVGSMPPPQHTAEPGDRVRGVVAAVLDDRGVRARPRAARGARR